MRSMVSAFSSESHSLATFQAILLDALKLSMRVE